MVRSFSIARTTPKKSITAPSIREKERSLSREVV